MLPVDKAEEPNSFDAKVRQPGLVYVSSLTSDIGASFDGREYWRKAIPELRMAYKCICAYTNHWVALDTGGNSIEHFIPKSVSAKLAYEWDNFRFVCSRLNARRGLKTVIDPFLVEFGMFEIIFPSLYLVVSQDFEGDKLLHDTLDILKLNDDIIWELSP